MEHFYEILWTVLGTVGSGIAIWLATVITNWLNKKIKDKKLADILSSITMLVFDCVQAAYQTTVSVLKAEGKFDEAAQKKVKTKVVNELIAKLTIEQKDYINQLGVDLKEWLGLQIESVIYQLKK